MSIRLSSLALASAIIGPLAAAQTDTAQVFVPADFERFSPLTAADMVRQIPGFSIEGTAGGRGLGQASSNVLINGERLTGKENDAADALARIPASRVVRIELVEAATIGIPGLSGRVANVIADGTGLSGVWDWQVRFRERLEPRYNEAEASLSGSLGDLDWTVGIDADGNRFGNKGPEFVSDGTGALVQVRNEELQGQFERVEGNVNLTWSPPGEQEANFNASYAIFNFNERLVGDRINADYSGLFREFRGGEDEWNSEISGDYAFPLFAGSLKLIGYYRHEDSRFGNSVFESALDRLDVQTGAKFDEEFIENEAIARAEYDWSTGTGRDWQFALENAYNRLDAGSDFLTLDALGNLTLVNRATPVLVDENRSEISLTHTRQVTPKLSAQVSLAAEYSELGSEVGEDVQARDFVRPKGYGALIYQANENLAATLRIDRQVGQLSFFDFVSSQDLNNEIDDAGNRNLVPDQTWRFEAELDRQYGTLGAATFTVFHEAIEDLVDQVPVAPGVAGAGNIDSAQRSGVSVDTTLNLDQFGLEGVQFSLFAEAFYSRVEDPLTGVDRWISRDQVSFVFSEIRWDIPNTPFATSVAYEQGRQAQNYRIDELRNSLSTPGFGWIEVEHKDLFGLNAFVRLANIFEQSDKEQRVRFAPDRLGAVVERREFDRDFGTILLLGLSGSF